MLLRRPHRTYRRLPRRTARNRLSPPSTNAHSDLLRTVHGDDAVWDHSTFSKNHDRLLDADVAAKSLDAEPSHPKVKRFLSDDHFSVDGTLVEAWASMKSFRGKYGSGDPPAPGRNGERNFHGQKRINSTHESKADPDAKLFRKAKRQASKVSFMGHALI